MGLSVIQSHAMWMASATKNIRRPPSDTTNKYTQRDRNFSIFVAGSISHAVRFAFFCSLQ